MREREREREAASSAVDCLLIVAAFETVDHIQQPRSSDRQTQRGSSHRKRDGNVQ
jgi:hypothetical protein